MYELLPDYDFNKNLLNLIESGYLAETDFRQIKVNYRRRIICGHYALIT